MRFVMWKSRDSQFYWELQADNNEIIAISETYVRKESAKHSIALIKAGAKTASVLDCTDGSKFDRKLP